MIIYLLTFDLFDAIEKISQSLMQIILLRHRQFRQKCTCKLNVYIFYLRSALDIIHDDRCDKKKTKQKKNTHTKNYYFIRVKPPFSVVEFSKTVTFCRNARFDVILTSVTIIKQGFLRKLFCYESFVDIEVKTL